MKTPFRSDCLNVYQSEGYLCVRLCLEAEPKDYDVYDFVLKNYYRFRFSLAVATDVKEDGRNPKWI